MACLDQTTDTDVKRIICAYGRVLRSPQGRTQLDSPWTHHLDSSSPTAAFVLDTSTQGTGALAGPLECAQVRVGLRARGLLA
eukprot:1545367-Alexandrium_andersonii.AAC.1